MQKTKQLFFFTQIPSFRESKKNAPNYQTWVIIMLININKKFTQQNKEMANQGTQNQFAEPTPIDIPTKLINEIQSGILTISKQSKPLKIRVSHSYGELELEGSRQIMIDRIRMSKDKTIQQLREIESQEKQMKEALRNLSNSRDIKRKKMQRSQFTEEQKSRIKQIIYKKKQEQIIRKKKHEYILDSFTNNLRKERQQQQSLVQRLKQQHKKAVQQNLVTIQNRKKIREESNKQVSKRMLQIKQKKYMYFMKEKQDQEYTSQKQEQISVKLEEIRERFKLDLNEISEHQSKYEAVMIKKSEERAERLRTQSIKGVSSSRKYSTNIFIKMLQQQQRDKRIVQMRKINQAKQLRSKIGEYQQKVKQKHRPRMRTEVQPEKKQQEFLDNTRMKKTSVLSYKQMLDKGNQYLKETRKLGKVKDQPKIVTEPQVKKYTDYLKGLNKKSKRAGTVQQFRSIVSKEDSIDYSQALKAKSLAEEIQAKSKRTKDDKMLESIQNKLDLLKILI